jgi:hypothetical protein
MPPVFLQDLTNGTFSNSEQQDLFFVKHLVGQWAQALRRGMNLKLFGQRNGGRLYCEAQSRRPSARRLQTMERRSLTEPVEVREESRTIAGYAAVFNSDAVIGGQFRERILPGAFRDAVEEIPRHQIAAEIPAQAEPNRPSERQPSGPS